MQNRSESFLALTVFLSIILMGPTLWGHGLSHDHEPGAWRSTLGENETPQETHTSILAQALNDEVARAFLTEKPELKPEEQRVAPTQDCLLYTSDAADE